MVVEDLTVAGWQLLILLWTDVKMAALVARNTLSCNYCGYNFFCKSTLTCHVAINLPGKFVHSTIV